jgi:hypothetical protein
MAWAVEERRTTATTRRVSPQRGQVRTSVWNVRLSSSAQGMGRRGPEAAMDLLLEKARLVHGDQDWSTWEWSAREYGTREPRVIPFFWSGSWVRPPP